MTELTIHQKNISTYLLCETLIRNTINELSTDKYRVSKQGVDFDFDKYFNVYYEHLERIQQLKNDYLKQNNLTMK